MSEHEVSDEEAIAAKDTLECALRDYYKIVQPEVLVTAWVIIVHKVSDEMDEEGVSSLGTLTPSGQIFPLTRGLLDVALECDRDELRNV